MSGRAPAPSHGATSMPWMPGDCDGRPMLRGRRTRAHGEGVVVLSPLDRRFVAFVQQTPENRPAIPSPALPPSLPFARIRATPHFERGKPGSRGNTKSLS